MFKVSVAAAAVAVAAPEALAGAGVFSAEFELPPPQAAKANNTMVLNKVFFIIKSVPLKGAPEKARVGIYLLAGKSGG